MAKKGVYKIEGNTSPKIGEKAFYKVVEWYPTTPLSDRVQSKVTWELFIKENGKFRPANLKKPIGEFTFGANADKFTYRVEGYLHSPEGEEPMSIIVQPQKNENPKPTAKKEILGVSLTYQDGSKITKTLNYQDKLRATAKCQALEGEHIVFYLWEDDEKNSGHNKKNQFIEKSPIIQVDSKGYARWDFTLLRTFISLAQKREDEDKKHEYYVTAEYNGKILNNSGNVNVNNPEPRIKITPKSSSNGAKPKTSPTVNKPKPQPDSPKGSTHQGSKNNQPDKKGVITNIKLTDLKGNAFKKRPKFGERIQLVIEGKDVKGKSYRLKIWEDDTTGKNDLLYNREHKFNGDKQIVYIDLTEDMQRVGEIGNNPKEPDSGEYWTGNYQEIYAEVILQNITTKSQIIDVDIKAEARKQENRKSPAQVNPVPEPKKKEEVCICQEYKLIWGQKVNCDFRKKVIEICKDLWPNDYKNMANNLMAVFKWESAGTFKPDAPNQADSGGTGLIQFMPETAKNLLGKEITIEKVKNYYGKKYNKKTKQYEDWYLKRVKEFANMTALTQLDYVKKYFEPMRGKKMEFVDFYLQVLFPVSSGLPEHVVFANDLKKLDRPSESDKLRNKRINAYSSNDGLDLNKDGKIMKSEIKTKVQPYITEGLAYINIEKCENNPETPKKDAVIGKCTEGTVTNGFINNSLITKNLIENCNKNPMTQDVKIVVLHRTAGGKASGTLTHMKNEGYGAHFVIDYDGTVYQAIGINKRASHMGVAQFQSTKKAGWGNGNSIGIETCGYSYDKDGNKRVGKKYDKIPHHHWEKVTDAQAQSVACLLKFLLNQFSLNIDDVKVHEKLCSKEPNEGQDVYDAMLPYFNKKD